jgi:hypothetical protein
MLINKHFLGFLILVLVFIGCAKKDTVSLEKARERFQIEFISPIDGEEISANNPGMTQIPCQGKVNGIIPKGCQIKVEIFTDKWYPQGIARIKEDGRWQVNPIYLGGAEHIIKADLIDDEGNVLTTRSIKVIRIQS